MGRYRLTPSLAASTPIATATRPDPSPDVWTRWLASAREQGVEFEIEPRVTANGTSWRAVARAVGR